MFPKMKINRSLLLLALLIGGFLLAKNVFALDVGTNEVTNAIQLGATDPRKIVARIINVAMMFLGIIAVGIIIFAGFKWMSSQGNEEQIESAKKILKAGVIGLVIILASWGIAAFILNRLINATGNNGTGTDGGNGGGGNLPPCSGNGCVGMACDDQPLVTGCQFSTSSCQAGLACSPISCTCQPCPASDPNCATNSGGGFGAACDSDLTNATCDASNEMCDANQGLTCDPNSCTCLGSPVITEISPVGGFCEGDVNKACDTDSDCAGGVGPCNINAPNGATNNIISIHGYNFGTTSTSTVGLSQVVFLGDEANQGDDKVALDPTAINPVCNDSWSNNEIIVAVPSGAVSGPIKVVNGSLNSNLIDFDVTNNEVGAQIPNFVSNTIARPGICRITPDNEVMGGSVSYFGNNLSGAGYFGNDANKFKGISSTFNSSNTSGSVLVPNVGAGYMSTFVMNPANQKSNFVAFRKNQEPPTPPSISNFDPQTGSAGQYVTIRGNGFGNSRGNSQVFFESTEASYSFPAVCLQSVWKDNQVIVKVPTGLANGSYNIKMKIGSWEQISAASNFSVNSALSLLPSLCKVEPSRGPVNAQVSFYGEYFSSSTSGVARFYNTKDSSGPISDDSGANKLKANVPIDAVTGPVRIVDNSRIGNSLNFSVGSCTNNSECDSGTPFCCPLGSQKQGQCAISLMNSTNGCYSSIPTSVFEWKFGTSLAVPCDSDTSNATCNASDAMCNSATLHCNTESCTCEPCPESNPQCGTESFYSCAQKGGGSYCPTGFCPNSPGQCSAYDGTVKMDTGVSCANAACNAFPFCSGNTCHYLASLNRCIKNVPTHCSSDVSVSLDFGNPVISSKTFVKKCVNYSGNNNRWEINFPGSCPNGWSSIGHGKCADTLSGSTCNVCAAGGKCINGTCATDKICPVGSTCNSNNKCETSNQASCDCCCEIGQDARDCCAPLTCGGTCGNDTNPNDNTGFGVCSGCAAVGTTQAEHDAACNCANTNGKFCNNNACVDCTALTDESDCVEHSASCCWDDKDGICRGGDGNSVSSNPGHCAYYACASASANTCGTSVSIYSTSTNISENYVFSNNQCNTCTSLDPGLACSFITTPDGTNGCKQKSGCCWDLNNGTATAKCVAGDKIGSGPDTGACDYYTCQGGLNSNQCIASTTPLTSGPYASWNSCSASCQTPYLGASCQTAAISTQNCNLSRCSLAGFNCMINSNPFIITSTTPATAGCGFCCCDPNATVDACTAIDPVLSCEADKGSCSGGDRGLCCGCQSDSQCGNSNVNGCAFDSCCHGRPGVAATNPVSGDLHVCRNAVISVTFTDKMDPTSLTGNVVLLAESSNGTCPAGTSHLALGDSNSHLNVFARIYNRVTALFQRVSNRIARIFNPNKAIAYGIDPNKNYCVTPGITTYETIGSNTILTFKPSSMLQANTNYIAVVKGQENLDNLASSTAMGKAGVLSSYKIGMAGTGLQSDTGSAPFGPFGVNGPTFNHSYAWHFKTLSDNNATSGLCLVDRVDLTPPAYIFQKNTNDDINEDDTSSIDPTFDTVADRDKSYTAKALSSGGQELQPVPAYSWTWDWNISDQTKINFIPGTDLANNGNRRLLGVQTGITDAAVTLKAETVMDSNNAIVTSNKSKEVDVRVFVCLNPWPPVNNIYQWEPSRDISSDIYGNQFGNYTYEFYYCRDAGDPNTTADDLPAISSGGDIINLGLSDRNVCSNNRSRECTSNSDCGSGFCIPDILKESYFFQQ